MLLGRELIVAYLVAMPLGRVLTIATRPRWRDVLLVIGATAAAALLAAVIGSKQYWGYYFHRPAVDERVTRARQVHSAMLVGTEPNTSEETSLVARPSPSLDEAIEWGRRDPYSTPRYRGLVALADRRLLPRTPPPLDPQLWCRLTPRSRPPAC